MAEIVIGVGTSHGPMLNTPPESWGARAVADRRNTDLRFRGASYTYEELVTLRGAVFARECLPEVWRRRHAACRAAIETLGERLRAAAVDVLVVVSSDHKEIFDDRFLAPFTVYWGDSVQHEPYTQADLDAMPPGLAIAEVANVPAVSTARACHPDVALHLLRETSAAGFDPAATRDLPAGRHGNQGIPHGWGFVYQQVLGGAQEIPVVPVFVNTFWQPNPPSAARSYDFGRALGRAVGSFPGDLRVGVVASGGLSHMVVDEEFDRLFLDALMTDDRDVLRTIAAPTLTSGTSEARNWLVAGGALAESGLTGSVVDYQPCYRSEAGTGCAMAFAEWWASR